MCTQIFELIERSSSGSAMSGSKLNFSLIFWRSDLEVCLDSRLHYYLGFQIRFQIRFEAYSVELGRILGHARLSSRSALRS